MPVPMGTTNLQQLWEAYKPTSATGGGHPQANIDDVRQWLLANITSLGLTAGQVNQIVQAWSQSLGTVGDTIEGYDILEQPTVTGIANNQGFGTATAGAGGVQGQVTVEAGDYSDTGLGDRARDFSERYRDYVADLIGMTSATPMATRMQREPGLKAGYAPMAGRFALASSAGRFNRGTGATEEEAFSDYISKAHDIADTRRLYGQMGGEIAGASGTGMATSPWARFGYTPQTAQLQAMNILRASDAALGVGQSFGQKEAMEAIYGQMAAENAAQAGQNFQNWVSSAWNPANQVTWGQ